MRRENSGAALAGRRSYSKSRVVTERGASLNFRLPSNFGSMCWLARSEDSLVLNAETFFNPSDPLPESEKSKSAGS